MVLCDNFLLLFTVPVFFAVLCGLLWSFMVLCGPLLSFVTPLWSFVVFVIFVVISRTLIDDVAKYDGGAYGVGESDDGGRI